MTTLTFPPGTQFRHPTQGVCTVTATSAKAVRYSSTRTPGFPPVYCTTTPGALAAVIDTGIIQLIHYGA